MKKLLALIVALMMALTCVSAFADNVYTKVTVNGDLAKGLLSGFGMPEDQMAIVDPVIALVNALGVSVTTVADGAQIDLDLNGSPAVTLGFAADEQGAKVVSNLIPNYLLTVSQETIGQLMEQVAANMPGAGGEGGMNMGAMMETFGGYFQPWFEACASAGQPGDPVTGEYEFEGYKFDTMVPVTVDMAVITEATRKLIDDLSADPAAMAAIKGFAQGFAQNTGETFDPENFEETFKTGMQEWMAHFPDTVTAEFYVDSTDEDGMPFYLQGESVWGEESGFTYYMLFVEEGNMDMGYQMTAKDGDEEVPMQAGFTMKDGGMSMYFSMGDMYIGLAMNFSGDGFAMDVYFMDADNPLVSVTVTMIEGGERTLAVDGAGKTTLAVEDVMSGQSEGIEGLAGDFMANGLGALMGTLSEQVPEVAGLMNMMAG
ncbi:MAG: hypothetical protein IJH86_08925 [Clostridia bacterium]|nr:hypothetical protein [Clostridia bacterium]